jgi:hypothetical protein
MAEKARLLASIAADTVKAQNTDVLAADFQVQREDAEVRICIAGTAVEVSLVPSTGSAIHLNGGSALPADGIHREDVLLDVGRTWNIQSANIAGVTVKHLIIQEVAEVGA